MKKSLSLFGLGVLLILFTGALSAATPAPNTSFLLVQGLPATMNVGDANVVTVQVTSDRAFLSAQAMPDFYFPGRGVVAVQGGDHAGGGTSATLNVTFKAKGSTAGFPGGVAPVAVVVGVRYSGGVVVVQRYDFNVSVP